MAKINKSSVVFITSLRLKKYDQLLEIMNNENLKIITSFMRKNYYSRIIEGKKYDGTDGTSREVRTVKQLGKCPDCPVTDYTVGTVIVIPIDVTRHRVENN